MDEHCSMLCSIGRPQFSTKLVAVRGEQDAAIHGGKVARQRTSASGADIFDSECTFRRTIGFPQFHVTTAIVSGENYFITQPGIIGLKLR